MFDYFWRYELVQRFGSKTHGRSQPWWFFVPVLILSLLPWTFFLRSPARIALRRWKEKSLASRHWLLLGWVTVPFLLLSISGSKLVTYILPLLPAFALALAASIKSARVVWAVAIPTVVVCLLLAANAGHFSPHLGRQASVKSLAELLQTEPEIDQALLFSCGVRAHAFAFYMGRVVSSTQGDADIVLPLDEADKARLFKGVRHCAEKLTGGARAYGIVNHDRYREIFLPRGWLALAHEGSFVLITNHPQASADQGRLTDTSAVR